MKFTLLLFISCLSLVYSLCTDDKHYEDHPVLCRMLEWLEDDPEGLAIHLNEVAAINGHLVDLPTESAKQQLRRLGQKASLPVVLAHGMGDSCFNRGMQSITEHISKLLGVYAVCIPTGPTQSEDTNNGFFLSMDASVEVFAQGVRDDPQLQGGFYAIGFSQGNNVIRGYIAKHNTPTVQAFISVNGVNAGEGAVPYCRPKTLEGGFSVCDLLMEQASQAAYTEFAQEHNFQANYWRDPRPAAKERYQKYSQLAKWNNEAGFVNQTLNENWAKTNAYVWVLASEDGMVWPKEGEQWGAPDPKDPFNKILPMKETEWYKEDLFGLKTADDAGKNFFEIFEGDHLQFTEEDLNGWLLKYFT